MTNDSSRGYWLPLELPREVAKKIDELASCWKRDQDKAAEFTQAVKRPILTWLSQPKNDDSATDTRDAAKALREAASALNRTLAGRRQSHSFMLDMQAEIRERLFMSMSGETHALLEGWQKLTAHCIGTGQPEPVVAFDIRDALEPLQGMLSLISDAAGGLEASIEPKRGRNVDHERELIRQLVMRYKEAFGKMPGKSSDSPLMLFWEGLRPIIGTESSYREVIKQIRELEK